MTLLKNVFLLDLLPAWHSNETKRLVKTPKLHLGDTGLAASLVGVDIEALRSNRALFGQLLETFVYQELRRLASWELRPLAFSHHRDRDQVEVDIVIERGAGELVGVEVKAGATVTERDFRGLRKLKQAAGDRFAGGVVLYDGDAALPFGDGTFALPLVALWDYERG